MNWTHSPVSLTVLKVLCIVNLDEISRTKSMVRGPLYQTETKPLFSGHETFPLRYGWLKKVYDEISKKRKEDEKKHIFLDNDAIALFGVGKNMVASMRHWAMCCGVITEDEQTGRIVPTKLGDFLFGARGVDPYLEDLASIWHLHWVLCSGDNSRPIKTTWFWVFNHYNGVNFRRDDLVEGLIKLAEARSWQRVSRTTIQRDVECLVRMYEVRTSNNPGAIEDNLESPMEELCLIRGVKGHFHLVRGSKPTLPLGIFTIALDSFWNRIGTSRSISFEMIAHEPGSPGRIFLLDESDIVDRLLSLEDLTHGVFRWSETAGLKQVLREHPLNENERQTLLINDYRRAYHRKEVFR